jgi:hypothetical protein
VTLVSHKYKFIYVKNYKVAGTSVEDFFSKWCVNPDSDFTYQTTNSHDKMWFSDGGSVIVDSTGDEHIDDYGIVGRTNGLGSDVWRGHTPLAEIKKAFSQDDNLGLEKFDEYLKFCVVRNPYDKLVSLYHWQINHPLGQKPIDLDGQDDISFADWLKSPTFTGYPNNLVLTHGLEGKSMCDYFIRYEHLEEDIVKLCEKLGLPDFDINDLPKHKSGIRPNRHYREYYDDETKDMVYRVHRDEIELFGYEF